MTIDADQRAAHQLLSELRTRIATQRLPYQHGVDASALKSLYELFDLTRRAMKEHPGCNEFAQLATNMLNTVVRPVTAKWHRPGFEQRLASWDGADEFRGDLERVRTSLLELTKELRRMAYGAGGKSDEPTPPALRQGELTAALAGVQFGILAGPSEGSGVSAVDAEKINTDERAAVAARRKLRGIQTNVGHDAVGLALSGGGIRSATFCLGVVQVLADRGLLGAVDFLSTVSGGGYTGSFLTNTLTTADPAEQVGRPRGPDTSRLMELRANAKYLMSAGLWQSWSRVVQTLAGLVLNWTVPSSALLLLALLAVLTHADSLVRDYAPLALGGLGAATALLLLLYALLIRGGRQAARVGNLLLAGSSGLLLLVALLSGLVLGHGRLQEWWRDHGIGSSLLPLVVLAGPAILRFVPVLRSPLARVLAVKLLLVLAALVLPLLGLLVFSAGWSLGAQPSVELPLVGSSPGWAVLGGLVFVLGLAAWLIDINQTGPHRLYRDALANTFIPEGVPELAQVNSGNTAPYHLINASLNLPSSSSRTIRERRADFFLFSRSWCGSVSTGYAPTEAWKVGLGAPIDLKTAMAVSGAAAAPHLGLLSLPPLVALITFLNVRLDFWMRKPPTLGSSIKPGDAAPTNQKQRRSAPWPGFLCLLKEMTGIGMSEKSHWLNLSDGGHLENTGCYELLRRRCKFVIAVDGEADPAYGFGGLLTLIRHVQIDLGIRIDPRLDTLRADPQTLFSRRHAILCRIEYPAAGQRGPEMGLLLYLKLSLTGNESELLAGYRSRHPEFPHQSTLDQFFDQEQFEAYRQLGVHVAEGQFSRAVLADAQGNPAPQPLDMRTWFERLAANLLEPVPER